MSDFKFEFGRPPKKKISAQEILDELEKVAKHFDYSYVRRKDFDKIAKIHSATVERCFGGSWSKAILALKERLKQKNINISPNKRRNISERELFEEMERIWRLVGHRPSKDEWAANDPKFSNDTVYRRFGGWTNACLKFIEFKSGGPVTAGGEEWVNRNNKVPSTHGNKDTYNKAIQKSIEKTRAIPLNIRVKILSRDNFRCVFCGKSPATDIGIKLHVDHIIPFSKGGRTTVDNLQTLCQDCNLGKSDEVYNK